MQAQIKQWGNSYGIRVPRSALRAASMSEDDMLEVAADNGVITLRKSPDIDTLFDQLEIEPFEVDYAREELYAR